MIYVRNAQARDEIGLLELEHKVWKPRDIAPITAHTFRRWLTTYADGFFVAERNNVICGYAYHERVHFLPELPPSPETRNLIEKGHTVSHHKPDGNALFGVSVATYPRGSGVGKSLVRTLIHAPITRKSAYLITLSRIPDMRHFLEQPTHREYPMKVLMHNYVHATVDLIRRGTTSLSPAPRRPDSVLGWFINNLDMEVHTLVKSSFRDPESCNRAVLLVRRLAPTV